MKRKAVITVTVMLVLSTLACRLFAGDVQPLSGESPSNAPQAQVSTVAPTKVPAPTVAAPPSEDSCIVGTWELKDFEQYMASVIPPEVTSAGELTFEGTTGYAAYTFTADHNASIQADAFVVNYNMNMMGISFPLDVGVNGSGTAEYIVSGDQILFSNVDSSNVLMTVNLNGSPMIPETPVTGIFPGSETNSSLTYVCNGNSLTLTMPVDGSAPVVLERAAP